MGIYRIRAKGSGIATQRFYLNLLGRNVERGLIQRPDVSRVRVEPTVAEFQAYKKEIEKLTIERHKTCVDADILSEAASILSEKVQNYGTADYTWAIRPGSDDPLHTGHGSAGLATILFLNLLGIPINGVVFATGGRNPEKLEMSSFSHRSAMAKMLLQDFQPWITPTNIRNLAAEILGKTSIIVGNKKVRIMGKKIVAQRTFCDTAAFDWIFAMNPHMQWHYQIGSDKFENYYKVPEEKYLVYDTLRRLEKAQKIVYFLRDPGDLVWIKEGHWLSDLCKEGYVIQSRVESYSVSGTLLRSKLRKVFDRGRAKPWLNLSWLLENGIPPISQSVLAFTGLGRAISYLRKQLHPAQILHILNEGLIDLYTLNDRVKNKEISRNDAEYKALVETFKEKGIIDSKTEEENDVEQSD